jgi:hypothetical protein
MIYQVLRFPFVTLLNPRHLSATNRTNAGVQNEGRAGVILFCFSFCGNLSATDKFTDKPR